MKTMPSKKRTLKTIASFFLFWFVSLASFGQSKYSMIGGVETPYKNQYTFQIRLDEVNKKLIFETNAPVTVVTLDVYTPEEYLIRKGKEYTNTHVKSGNTYSYDLNNALLKDKEAYWLKVSIGNNGVPLAEYLFKKRATATEPVRNENNEEVKDATGATVIQTNATCTDGKTKLMASLKALDGVRDVKIDPRGTVKIIYSNDGTPYSELLATINENGFSAGSQKSNSPDKNPCIKKIAPEEKYTRQTGRNIFDARKGFAIAPIKHVDFTVTPDAAKKGFKMDSIYTWTAPDGEVKMASGEEILKQVNEMERELNFRGRTLRKQNAFSALSYKLINQSAVLKIPKSVTKISDDPVLKNGPGKGIYKIPIIKTKHNKLPDVSGKFSTVIGGDVGVYFGRIISNTGEFQGNISTSSFIDNSKCIKQCPLDITLSLDAKIIQSLNISNCVLEISDNPDRKPNDNTNILATGNFNFKKPAFAKYGTENVSISGDAPPSFHTLYSFSVKINDLSKLAKAAIKPVLYYAYVKFYNDKGDLLYYSSYNTAVLESKIDVPIFIGQDKKVNAGFEDAFTDPTGLFGMYYKSSNLNATYSTKRDEATLVISENAKLSGDVEIGAQYYNFWYLLDNDQPKYERKSFISANFSSDYTKKYTQGRPPIRRPGAEKKSNDMNNYPGYQLNYSIFDGETTEHYTKASGYTTTRSLVYNLFDERFFIGPVPCRITVDMSSNASFTRQSTIDTLTDGTVSLSTSVTPHLDLTLTGKGGVDAAIAYATIVANVKVIEVDLPISAKANKDVDLEAALKITALSGEIYFTAGLCIPIPWFDDLCTDFRIDIFKWTGPSKTYPLVK
ncbi:MAG: hypothetical protein KAY50_07085 [Chitinophagaceae bacterium]|nr:hypothetical protein [Chitinophagaceae bacterium]